MESLEFVVFDLALNGLFLGFVLLAGRSRVFFQFLVILLVVGRYPRFSWLCLTLRATTYAFTNSDGRLLLLDCLSK